MTEKEIVLIGTYNGKIKKPTHPGAAYAFENVILLKDVGNPPKGTKFNKTVIFDNPGYFELKGIKGIRKIKTGSVIIVKAEIVKKYQYERIKGLVVANDEYSKNYRFSLYLLEKKWKDINHLERCFKKRISYKKGEK